MSPGAEVTVLLASGDLDIGALVWIVILIASAIGGVLGKKKQEQKKSAPPRPIPRITPRPPSAQRPGPTPLPRPMSPPAPASRSTMPGPGASQPGPFRVPPEPPPRSAAPRPGLPRVTTPRPATQRPMGQRPAQARALEPEIPPEDVRVIASPTSDAPAPSVTTASPQHPLMARLRRAAVDRSELQAGLVWAEVLGAPLALRDPLERTSGF